MRPEAQTVQQQRGDGLPRCSKGQEQILAQQGRNWSSYAPSARTTCHLPENFRFSHGTVLWTSRKEFPLSLSVWKEELEVRVHRKTVQPSTT